MRLSKKLSFSEITIAMTIRDTSDEIIENLFREKQFKKMLTFYVYKVFK